ncbi:hypothetical protein [Caudoviricetes sp.]|nr:hypothetical protein [Caudoviricetes sp.]
MDSLTVSGVRTVSVPPTMMTATSRKIKAIKIWRQPW